LPDADPETLNGSGSGAESFDRIRKFWPVSDPTPKPLRKFFKTWQKNILFHYNTF
jgi:hypothetical protein